MGRDIWDMPGPFLIEDGAGHYLSSINSWKGRFRGTGKVFTTSGRLMAALTTIGNAAYFGEVRRYPEDRLQVSEYIPESWVIKDLGSHFWARARRYHQAMCLKPTR